MKFDEEAIGKKKSDSRDEKQNSENDDDSEKSPTPTSSGEFALEDYWNEKEEEDNNETKLEYGGESQSVPH